MKGKYYRWKKEMLTVYAFVILSRYNMLIAYEQGVMYGFNEVVWQWAIIQNKKKVQKERNFCIHIFLVKKTLRRCANWIDFFILHFLTNCQNSSVNMCIKRNLFWNFLLILFTWKSFTRVLQLKLWEYYSL